MEEAKRAPRRAHSAEVRTQVLAECSQPGASVAKVAMAYGLNANLVHKWRRAAAGASASTAVSHVKNNAGEFVALALAPPSAAVSSSDIRIELRRGATTMSIHWPAQGGGDCAAWLRDWLR